MDTKVYKKEQVMDFQDSDWEFERSSGYAGYRNINQSSPEYGKWIFDSNPWQDSMNTRKSLRDKYNKEYKVIMGFLCTIMPETPLIKVEDYLDEKYFM